jgi:hypothetical protein
MESPLRAPDVSRTTATGIAFATLCLVVAACAGSSGAPGPTPGRPGATPSVLPSSTSLAIPSDATPTRAAPTPWPTIEPRLAFGDQVSCGSGKPVFPVEMVNARPDAQEGTESTATALRAFLARPMGNPAPNSTAGWRRVLATNTDVLFLSTESPGTRWVYLGLSSTGEGQTVYQSVAGWHFATSGDCKLEVSFGVGQRRAEIYLDPARPIRPTDWSVSLQLAELTCSSGQSPAGRVLEPMVAYEADRILAAISIRNRPGGPHDCQGGDTYPYTLQLKEPIGSRQLFDAARVPPVPVVALT